MGGIIASFGEMLADHGLGGRASALHPCPGETVIAHCEGQPAADQRASESERRSAAGGKTKTLESLLEGQYPAQPGYDSQGSGAPDILSEPFEFELHRSKTPHR